MTYAELFSAIKNELIQADVSDIKEHLAWQFNVTGEASGIFYIEIKNGNVSIEPYEYYDRDVIFIADADTFLNIANGTLDPIKAVTKKKLRFEGDTNKALRLNDLIKDKNKKK